MHTRRSHVIGLIAGILVFFVTVLAATLILTDGYPAASTHAAAPSAVRSISVYEALKAIGDLAEPAPFSVLHVVLTSGESNVELMAKIMPEQDERILLVSALDEQIITALTPGSVVGRSLPGEYEIREANQEALLRLSGLFPQASRQVMVATILSERPDGVRLLAQVTASMKKDMIPGGQGALALGAAGSGCGGCCPWSQVLPSLAAHQPVSRLELIKCGGLSVRQMKQGCTCCGSGRSRLKPGGSK
jgi:hypothetical protein